MHIQRHTHKHTCAISTQDKMLIFRKDPFYFTNLTFLSSISCIFDQSDWATERCLLKICLWFPFSGGMSLCRGVAVLPDRNIYFASFLTACLQCKFLRATISALNQPDWSTGRFQTRTCSQEAKTDRENVADMVIIFARRPIIPCEGVLAAAWWGEWICRMGAGLPSRVIISTESLALAVAVRRSAATRCPHLFSDRLPDIQKSFLPWDSYLNTFPTLKFNCKQQALIQFEPARINFVCSVLSYNWRY